jgi:hypothetical protein
VVPTPATYEATLRTVRLRYNAAYTAYQSCVIAMNETAALGQAPSETLLANEAKSLGELNEARGNLLAAMAKHAERQSDRD